MRTLKQVQGERAETRPPPPQAWGQSNFVDHPKYGRLQRGTVCERRVFRVKEAFEFGLPGKARPVEPVAKGDLLPWFVPEHDDLAYIKKQADHGRQLVTVMFNGMRRFIDLKDLDEL